MVADVGLLAHMTPIDVVIALAAVAILGVGLWLVVLAFRHNIFGGFATLMTVGIVAMLLLIFAIRVSAASEPGNDEIMVAYIPGITAQEAHGLASVLASRINGSIVNEFGLDTYRIVVIQLDDVTTIDTALASARASRWIQTAERNVTGQLD